MNKYLKYFLLGGQILFVILLIIGFFYIKKTNTNYKSQLQNTLQKLNQYKDINNQLYEKLNQQYVSINQMKSINDSLASALKIKNKNIVSSTTITQKIDTVIQIKHDTTFQIKDTPFHYIFDTSFYFSINDTLHFLQQLKSHLFKPDEYTLYIKNTSPYVHITSGNSYILYQKKPIFTMGPALLVDPFNGKVSVGISIQIPLIKINRN